MFSSYWYFTPIQIRISIFTPGKLKMIPHLVRSSDSMKEILEFQSKQDGLWSSCLLWHSRVFKASSNTAG